MKIEKDSYMYEMILFELKDIVGDENVSTSSSDKIAYSVDYYWVSELWHDRGLDSPTPDFIMHPKSSEEVSKILLLANEYKIPVTVWGGGAGSQGGALPVCRGILIDIKKMNRIHNIDLNSMTVEVETGIIMEHLERELENHGVSTMHLPASFYCSTVGGFIAHRGTGVLSTKYGKMEDMIVTMEVVLPDGSIINTLPVPKTASGPDLNWFFIGSEGTLGIITKVTMKIHKIPEDRRFRGFLFKNIHEGIEVGRKIIHYELHPCVIRLYDEAETKSVIKRVLGIDRKGAYLVFGFDGKKEFTELEMKYAVDIAKGENGSDLGSEPGEEWWNNRYKFFFPPYCFRLPQAFGTCDTVAAYSNIEGVYREMKKTVEENFPQARFIGHFSHWFYWGCMLYARFIIDNPPEDAGKAIHIYNKIWNEVLRASMRKGGVLNEHHGVGLKLGRLMKEQYGNSFIVLKGIKKMLDPNNIMNPGKMGFGF